MDEWQRELRGVLASVGSKLDVCGLEEIERLMAHDEPEMALEGLLIEALKLPPSSGLPWEKLAALARAAGIDDAQVYDTTVFARVMERLGGA